MLPLLPSPLPFQSISAAHPQRWQVIEGHGMYYPIAEEELQVIQNCMQQISLMTDLCCEVTTPKTTVGTEGLLSFLIAQREALREAIEAVQAREATRGPYG